MDKYFNQLNIHQSNFQRCNWWFEKMLRDDLNMRQELRPQITGFRDYQIEAVIKTKEYFESKYQGGKYPIAMIVAPTGAGKSGMITMLPYVLPCSRVLILSPSKIITKQLADEFGKSLDSPSFIERICKKKLQNGFLEFVTVIDKTNQVTKDQMSNLVIANAQKFGGRSKASLFHDDITIVKDVKTFFEQFCTIIVDEAHHWPSKTWVAIVENFQVSGKRILFLTATPEKKGKPILPEANIVYAVQKSQIEGKTIRRCTFTEIPSNEINVPQKFESDAAFGLFLQNEIRRILEKHDNDEPRIKHQALILVRLTDEATSLASNLNQWCNTFAVAISSSKSTQEKITAFTRGTFRVGIVCGMLLEGYDNNKISVCIILRKVSSKIVFSQFVGRCLRMFPFGENEYDRTGAEVLSFESFNQRKMWEQMEQVAEDDPQDDDTYDV